MREVGRHRAGHRALAPHRDDASLRRMRTLTRSGPLAALRVGLVGEPAQYDLEHAGAARVGPGRDRGCGDLMIVARRELGAEVCL